MLFQEIDDERERRNISQVALCRQAGIKPQSYTKWRKGKWGITEVNLVRLQNALKEISEAATSCQR